MINVFWWIVGITAVCIGLPILTFQCVKLGTYGYYMARRLYLKENERTPDNNGE